jgi:predicted DNA-binding ribbon-helix-helix protein
MYSPLPADPAQDLPAKAKKTVRSTLVSRNITIAGHRTSVRLEPDMWSGLMEACRRERTNLHAMCTKVSQGKNVDTSLTAAIRVHVMNYFRAACTEEGHFKVGHGSNMRMSVPVHAAHAATAVPASANASNLQQPQVNAPNPRSAPFMIGMSRMNTMR